MNSLTINIRSPKPSINWSHLPEKIRTLFKQDDIANLLKELKK